MTTLSKEVPKLSKKLLMSQPLHVLIANVIKLVNEHAPAPLTTAPSDLEAWRVKRMDIESWLSSWLKTSHQQGDSEQRERTEALARECLREGFLVYDLIGWELRGALGINKLWELRGVFGKQQAF